LDLKDQIIRGMTCVYENKTILPPPDNVLSTSVNKGVTKDADGVHGTSAPGGKQGTNESIFSK
jgi:hypothetical protein